MPLFQNKYRIKSTRLPKWDYGSDGMYFVTMCTKNKQYYFGDIFNGNMQLSKLGEISNNYWIAIPDHFPFVQLHEYVIMPNHVHGILEICKRRDEATPRLTIDEATPRLTIGQHPHMSHISPKPQSLSVIIGSFKSIVTKIIHQNFPEIPFAWQPRYHDHIIRNETDLNRIRKYIRDNPLKWDMDKYNPAHIRKEHKHDKENINYKNHPARNYPKQNIFD